MTHKEEWDAKFRDDFYIEGLVYKGQRHWKDVVKESFILNHIHRREAALLSSLLSLIEDKKEEADFICDSDDIDCRIEKNRVRFLNGVMNDLSSQIKQLFT